MKEYCLSLHLCHLYAAARVARMGQSCFNSAVSIAIHVRPKVLNNSKAGKYLRLPKPRPCLRAREKLAEAEKKGSKEEADHRFFSRPRPYGK